MQVVWFLTAKATCFESIKMSEFKMTQKGDKIIAKDKNGFIYPSCEVVTAATIQEEPWYGTWQTVAEIVTYTEPRLEGDIERAITLCKNMFAEFLGTEDWRPNDDRLRIWIQEMFDNSTPRTQRIEHLGDGAYITHDSSEGRYILTANHYDPEQASDVVYLEPFVMENLIDFVQRPNQ